MRCSCDSASSLRKVFSSVLLPLATMIAAILFIRGYLCLFAFPLSEKRASADKSAKSMSSIYRRHISWVLRKDWSQFSRFSVIFSCLLVAINTSDITRAKPSYSKKFFNNFKYQGWWSVNVASDDLLNKLTFHVIAQRLFNHHPPLPRGLVLVKGQFFRKRIDVFLTSIVFSGIR